jgi:hypothetical protein
MNSMRGTLKFGLAGLLIPVFSLAFYLGSADPSVIWQRIFEGGESEGAYSVAQKRDGGCIVAGYTRSNDGNVSGNHGFDTWVVIRLDSRGEVIRQKILGGSDDDYAFGLVENGGWRIHLSWIYELSFLRYDCLESNRSST